MSENERYYMTLNGTKAAKSNIVGYCRLHKVHLTVAQLKQKDCLGKDCQALKRWDHKWWEHRERIKELKKLKKEQGIPSWQKVKIRTDHDGNLLPKVKENR